MRCMKLKVRKKIIYFRFLFQKLLRHVLKGSEHFYHKRAKLSHSQHKVGVYRSKHGFRNSEEKIWLDVQDWDFRNNYSWKYRSKHMFEFFLNWHYRYKLQIVFKQIPTLLSIHQNYIIFFSIYFAKKLASSGVRPII